MKSFHLDSSFFKQLVLIEFLIIILYSFCILYLPNKFFLHHQNDILENIANPHLTLNDTEQEIVKILDEYVKPAVASDGGNIIFDSYEDSNKSVKVLLQGACSGCPSSTFTLKNGIENILKEMLPDKVESVEAVNG